MKSHFKMYISVPRYFQCVCHKFRKQLMIKNSLTWFPRRQISSVTFMVLSLKLRKKIVLIQKIYCDFINSDHIVLFLSTEIKLESFVHLFLSKWVIYLLYRICHPNLKPVIFLVGIIMTRIFLPKSRENVTLTNSTLKLLV